MRRRPAARSRRKTAPARPPRSAAPATAIRYRVEGPAAWITLDRPDRKNALSGSMREDLLERLRQAGADEAVRAVVITGAGEAFCAGGDIAVMAELRARGADFEELGRWMDLGGRIVTALSTLPKPTLASLNGPAAGAGCNLALACDFRIASTRAALGETFSRVGLHPDWGGTYFLPRLVGSGRALELFALGEMVGAREALVCGLVYRVVPPARLAAETKALAARLAGLPRDSFLLAREAARRGTTAALSAMLAYERYAQRLCWDGPDSAEGIRAFFEKRPARFSGR